MRVLPLIIILIFQITFSQIVGASTGSENTSKNHCVKIGNRNHCPQVGGANTCPFNRGRCRLQNGGDHDFVQDHGYGGFEASAEEAVRRAANLGESFSDFISFITQNRTEQGDLNVANPECFSNVLFDQILRPTAGTNWNGNADDANYQEFVTLNCKGGYRFSELQNVLDTIREYEELLDPYQEELAYQTAFNDIADFTTCQARFFDQLTPGKPERQEMINIAFNQFSPIKNELETRKEELDELIERLYGEQIRRTINSCRQITRDVQDFKGGRGSCNDQTTRIFNSDPQVIEKRAEIAKLEERLDQLMSRIPLGNRGVMQTGLLELARTNGRVSRADFTRVYGGKLNAMINNTSDMVGQIMDQTRINPSDPSKLNYCIDRTLKRNIQRSDQLRDSLESRGIDEDLDQFLLRSENRYGVASEIGAELLLLPVSFGGYGLARLGAGLAVRGARLARAGSTIQRVTRAGLLGVEAADWTAVAATIQRDCLEESNEFYTNIPENGVCNPLKEIEQVYTEASLMSCATSWLVPAAIAGYGRLASASARVGDEVAQVGSQASRASANSSADSADEISEIVVTGTRDRSRDFFQDGQDIDVSDSLTSREIFVGNTMTDDQIRSLSEADRISLFQSASGRTLTRSQANRIKNFVEEGEGIFTPQLQSRLRNYLNDELGLNPNQIDDIIARLKKNRFFELPENELFTAIRSEFRTQLEGVPLTESYVLVRQILEAKKLGINDGQIKRAIKDGGNSCTN